MIFRPLAEPSAEPTLADRRRIALKCATILRDVSFRTQTTSVERHACRALMREQALKWRRAEIAPE